MAPRGQSPVSAVPAGGDARRLASGSILQQISGIAGLLAMLAIVTVLARRLTLAEFGVYGMLASLAGYLLVVQNAAATAAVAGIAASRDPAERSRAFSTAAALYAAAGVATGLALFAVGVLLSLTVDMPADVARQARVGSALIGIVTAVGWPLTVYRDALRADLRFARVAGVEVVSVLAFAAVVLLPALAGASLSVLIGASGALPLIVGIGCALSGVRRDVPRRASVSSASAREFARLAGNVSFAEAANAAIYALNRIILGIFRSSSTVALYEGPVRAQSLVRSLSGAITVTALPAASRYVAAEDAARLRELLVRGARYSTALLVPVAVTGMVLAGPVLEVWLGPGFRDGGPAMAILLAYWLVTAPTGVTAAVLIASGRSGDLARYAGAVTAANVVLAVALVEPLGLEGVAIATALPYVAGFPWLLRRALAVAAVPATSFARSALAPAYALAVVLAGGLLTLRLAASPESLVAVAGSAVVGLAAYWCAFYALCMDARERRLVRDVARGFAGLRPGG